MKFLIALLFFWSFSSLCLAQEWGDDSALSEPLATPTPAPQTENEIKKCSDIVTFLKNKPHATDDSADSISKFDRLVVSKQARKLWAFSNHLFIQEYSVSLGSVPVGAKTTENDKKTPEGLYFIDSKNPNSAYYKALHTSYPAERDRAQARQRGVNPGYDIMIHGFPLSPRDRYDAQIKHSTSKNWTDGCMAVSDQEIEEIYARVSVGTPILICP